MRLSAFSGILTAALMLSNSGCSPWQAVEVDSYLDHPERAPIRVTTVYGDTYEGGVRNETTSVSDRVKSGHQGSSQNRPIL